MKGFKSNSQNFDWPQKQMHNLKIDRCYMFQAANSRQEFCCHVMLPVLLVSVTLNFIADTSGSFVSYIPFPPTI